MPKFTVVQSAMTPQQANRIQNAANRTRQTIYVVGSRANGTAHAGSDWDYVLTGSKDQRQSAKSSLPGWMSEDNAAQNNLGHGYTNTGRGIDIFHNYSPHDARGGYVALDTTRPYVEFVPNVPVVGLPGRGPVNPAFIAAHAIGNPNTGLQYVNSRRGAQGEAFDIPST